MAHAAPRICTYPGCGVLVRGGPRCAKHPAPTMRGKTATKRTRGRKWMAIRQRVLRMEPRCVECLKAGRLAQADKVDHRVPLEEGGTDDESNLQGLCHPCHARKTAIEQARRG